MNQSQKSNIVQAARYASILPPPLALVSIGFIVGPLGRSLTSFLTAQQISAPKFTELVVNLSASAMTLPVHIILAVVCAGLLVLFARNGSKTSFFPLILTLIWTVIFLYTAILMAGFAQPYVEALKSLSP